MAILCLSNDLADLKTRLGNIFIVYTFFTQGTDFLIPEANKNFHEIAILLPTADLIISRISRGNEVLDPFLFL